jgi:hypothetical protein
MPKVSVSIPSRATTGSRKPSQSAWVTKRHLRSSVIMEALIPQPRRADQATPQSPVIMEALIPQSAELIKPRPKPSVIMENP